ncbi:SMAD/FHA domain-containing protein [Plenodomus tracheiphilus IPT5]|uniref:RING-type E3 ubiquitin transferase n=1 Tax=Plenodomus tracheiphilus IPT5 TaxID=1408161 RepID=A0A6A7B7N7_9PLEO|nr:SMAD/FHA domain-containing protein [Plenodomus tracheiphilus IPT5]
MTRSRAETTAPQLTVRNTSGPTPTTTPAPAMAEQPESGADAAGAVKHLPSIRFIPHQDPRAGRPSLQFPTITRTLPDESAIIRVGRYSERDNPPEITSNAPSAAAVGFKSKVVSRKHCELWCKDGSWYIKDVKSSSGTFLNHIRLSQPNVESKPFRIKDGDIIQLGIDFRGGEEMIFRCVKIRVECNRGWQQGLNNFNKQTHQRLRNLAKSKKEGDTASTHTSECAICLMSIAPCQSLFVAPCSHVWHYKCIRPILNGPTWPNFLCPNCRAVADLEEDVEEPEMDEWEEDAEHADGEAMAKVETQQGDRHITPRASQSPVNGSASEDSAADLARLISNINVADSLDEIANQPLPETPDRHLTPPATSSVTQPVPINISSANEYSGLSPLHPAIHNGLMPDRAPDGPMTPRNDVGPFVLDGSAGRAAGNRLRDDSSDSSSSGGVPTLPPVRFD